MAEADRSLAIFIDFENLARGIANPRERFDVTRVLERLVEKGKIVAKKAYADWNRFSGATFALHEAAIELIEIPCRNQTGKNSADIRLCVDAMDLAYSKEHINTFVILSGDSDFSPLVSKLKELGKHVIGLGMQKSTSDLLRDNCDEFIYYEDLGQIAAESPAIDLQLPEMKRKAFALLLESLLALRRENKDVLWSSMIKDTMKRKKPSFNETYHGYRTFSELLEDAAHHGLLELDTDKRSRTYVVTRFGSELHHDAPPPVVAAILPISPAPVPIASPVVVAGPAVVAVSGEVVPPGGQKKGRRRRRGRGRGAGTEGNGNGHGPQVARPGGMVVVPMNPPVEIPPRGETPPPHSAPPQPVKEEVFVSSAPAPTAPMPEPEFEPEVEPELDVLPDPATEPQPATHSDFAAGLDEMAAPRPAAPAKGVQPQPAAKPQPAPPKKPRPRAPRTAARQDKPAPVKQTPSKPPAPKTRRGSAKEKPKPPREAGESS